MSRRFLFALTLLFAPDLAAADGVLGYYRYPALAGDTVIFAAEGDLWVVSTDDPREVPQAPPCTDSSLDYAPVADDG